VDVCGVTGVFVMPPMAARPAVPFRVDPVLSFLIQFHLVVPKQADTAAIEPDFDGPVFGVAVGLRDGADAAGGVRCAIGVDPNPHARPKIFRPDRIPLPRVYDPTRPRDVYPSCFKPTLAAWTDASIGGDRL
jgi:hypothetical protein